MIRLSSLCEIRWWPINTLKAKRVKAAWKWGSSSWHLLLSQPKRFFYQEHLRIFHRRLVIEPWSCTAPSLSHRTWNSHFHHRLSRPTGKQWGHQRGEGRDVFKPDAAQSSPGGVGWITKLPCASASSLCFLSSQFLSRPQCLEWEREPWMLQMDPEPVLHLLKEVCARWERASGGHPDENLYVV